MSFVEKTLYQLFSEYTRQGSLYKTHQLRSHRLTELLKDAKVFDNSFSVSKLPAVVHSVNARSPTFSFQKFCMVVAKLAESKYSGEFRRSRAVAYDRLFSEHLLPRAQEMSTAYAVVRRTDLNLSKGITAIVQSLFKGFRILYEASFPAELSAETPFEDLFQNGLKQFETLLLQFDIYPNVLNKATVHGLWRDIVVIQPDQFSSILSTALLPSLRHERGRVFTLSKFILALYLCTVYGLQTTSLSKPSSVDKFVELLERIHFTVAHRFKRFNLLPAPELLLQVEDRPTSEESTDVGLLTEIQMQRLQAKFVEYCSLRGVDGTLKSAGFLKFLQDADLLERLTPVDARLVFVSSTSKTGSMKFPAFLKSIDLLSEKLLLSVEQLVLDHFLVAKPLGRPGDAVKAYHTCKHLESVEDRVRSTLLKPMQYFFSFYAGCSQLLSFRDFMRFCKDFGIFPDIVPNKRLIETFTESRGQAESLTLESFVRTLVVLANEVEAGQTPPEKLSFFFERLCQSAGPARVFKQQGHSQNAGKDLQEAVRSLKASCQPDASAFVYSGRHST